MLVCVCFKFYLNGLEERKKFFFPSTNGICFSLIFVAVVGFWSFFLIKYFSDDKKCMGCTNKNAIVTAIFHLNILMCRLNE